MVRKQAYQRRPSESAQDTHYTPDVLQFVAHQRHVSIFTNNFSLSDG
jgi:hypothetical protein